MRTEMLDKLLYTPRDKVLWGVVRMHLNEADFLFDQWTAALGSPQYTLDDLARCWEERLAAHLRGLAVGGPAVAERLLYPELEEARDPEKAAIAALVMLSTGSRDLWREVFDVLTATDDEEQLAAVHRALMLYEAPRFDTVLLDTFAWAGSPRDKARFLEVITDRGLDPGEALADCLDLGFPRLEAAAVRAAGHAGRRALEPAIEERLGARDPAVRDAALEAGLLFGLDRAWSRCRDRAARAGEHQAAALLRLALLGGDDDHRIILDRLGEEASREAALWALGFTGRIEHAQRCLPYLRDRDPRVAKLAAEAIAGCTGLDLLHDQTFQARPEAAGGLPPLDRDDLDADLVDDAVDELPAPDAPAIEAWFAANRERFDPKERYLAGQPHGPAALVAALSRAPMRRRHAHALELAVRTNGRRKVATEAFSARQRRQVEALRDLSHEDLGRRFGAG